MTVGTPREARWLCDEPRRTLERSEVERVVHLALGSRNVTQITPLTDGFRNASFKIGLTGPPDQVVLRLYEHDPVLCRKEIDLMQRVSGSVAIPAVIHAEPHGLDGLPPFILMSFVEGISVRDFRRVADRKALAEAGYAIGQTLAAIGSFSFRNPGWISAGLEVTAPLLEGSDRVPRFVGLCLDSTNARKRVPQELSDRIRTLTWNWAPQLAALDSQSQLVHSDLGHRNLLMRCIEGRWRVAAVLDWEFAVSASPLADIGHFMFRHDQRSMNAIKPHFVQGYLEAGGTLPDEWQRLARLLDLTALCESLTHERLPEAVTDELVELVRQTTAGIISD